MKNLRLILVLIIGGMISFCTGKPAKQVNSPVATGVTKKDTTVAGCCTSKKPARFTISNANVSQPNR